MFFFPFNCNLIFVLDLSLSSEEYCYGGHPLNYSGIFALVPQDTEVLGPNYSHKTTIVMGRTDFTESDIALILEDMGPYYRGDQYHLLHRNCNHFSDAFVQILCGSSLPKWINRLATVGAKLPFIERSIPKMWLTPRPIEELDNSQDELVPDYSSVSCPALATGTLRPRRRSRLERRGSSSRHTDRRDSSDVTPRPQNGYIPSQLIGKHSRNASSLRNLTPSEGNSDFLSDGPRLPPAKPLISGTEENNGTKDHATLRCLGRTHSSDIDTVIHENSSAYKENSIGQRKDKFVDRFSFPLSSLLASRRPSSVYLSPVSRFTDRLSVCSTISENGTLQLSAESGEQFDNTKGFVHRSTVPTLESITCIQPDPKTPASSGFTPKQSHCASTPSEQSMCSSNCAGALASGLLNRLQNLCGTSQTNDSIRRNPLYES
ncbi:hypothetical protein PHET_05483 [Paragonimus heterotremus]|uniref:PPPDE domain-containing protein n=1 Tax=Paragonimus heterotremus TaxID=100268 RepID=A0A8J4X023_9TREM|nr:hypothetical protein PHET_05483 [Paragonimus heterotremus]